MQNLGVFVPDFMLSGLTWDSSSMWEQTGQNRDSTVQHRPTPTTSE